MNFFEQQEHARKVTCRLVLFFGLAVVGIVVLTYLLCLALFATSPELSRGMQLWNPALLAGVCGFSFLVIGGGTGYKILALSGGGISVAESLGGRPLDYTTANAQERKLLNVIEEMAIASGTPVPRVYLLEAEDQINAFAAGYDPKDAVIGVTRGCVERLSRDELQGVMAHEFSHILNGDMRLNIRLMGLIHGILILGIIGYYVLRTSAFSGAGSRRSSKNDGGGAAAILGLGLGLMVIGGIGTFFGNLIKAAVSRQREFLADASAVQFTRNPDGLAGALKKIGQKGSRLESPNAPEASHLYFGQGVSALIPSLFATHPPLEQRILRIDPSWDGDFTSQTSGKQSPGPAKARQSQTAAKKRQLMWALTLLGGLSDDVRETAHEPYGARALVYGLLLHEDPTVRAKQLRHLGQSADSKVVLELQKLQASLEQLPAGSALPLIDLSLPALRGLSLQQYKVFCDNIDALIAADNHVSLFEWTLQKVLRSSLDRMFYQQAAPKARIKRLGKVLPQLRCLLSHVARAGKDTSAAQTALDSAWGLLQLGEAVDTIASEYDFAALDASLQVLEELIPPVKERVLAACELAVKHDGKIEVEEYELLRAVAATLACPMPPLQLDSPS